MERVRERVEQIRDQRPPAPTVGGGIAVQSATTKPQVVRHAGVDRYGTAAALADYWWRDYLWNEEGGPLDYEKVVFIANGQDFPDALSGGAAAGAWGGPILLARQDKLFSSTRTTLEGLDPDAIVVLGGTSAIGTEVEDQLRTFVPEADNVHRVEGKDRYEVSARVAEMTGRAPMAFVASGTTYADGLAGGAAAASAVSPLLLTKPEGVPGVVVDALRNTVRPSLIYVLGGTSAVSDDVVAQLKSQVTSNVVRINGRDRFVVAEKVADLHDTTNGATVAYGLDWPDALAGSAFAGVMRDKLLLLKSDGVPQATQRAMHKHGLVYLDALGGTTSLPESVLTALRSMDVVVAE